MAPASVLIIGAGPTGLVLGLSLACRGVSFRLVDENTGPGQHSRAMAVQARTLEFYRQLVWLRRRDDRARREDPGDSSPTRRFSRDESGVATRGIRGSGRSHQSLSIRIRLPAG